MAENGDNVSIPPNADKILFADDMMEFALKTAWPDYRYSATDYVCFRHLVHNGFTDAVKKTLEIIDEELDVHMYIYFQEMKKANRLNMGCLIDYANKHGPPDMSDGFPPDLFLMYCTHVVYFAGYLVSVDIDEAIHLAIDLIVRAFPEGEVSKDTWQLLQEAAEKYVKVEKDFSALLTPRWSDEELDNSNSEESDSSNSGSDSG